MLPIRSICYHSGLTLEHILYPSVNSLIEIPWFAGKSNAYALTAVMFWGAQKLRLEDPIFHTKIKLRAAG